MTSIGYRLLHLASWFYGLTIVSFLVLADARRTRMETRAKSHYESVK